MHFSSLFTIHLIFQGKSNRQRRKPVSTLGNFCTIVSHISIITKKKRDRIDNLTGKLRNINKKETILAGHPKNFVPLASSLARVKKIFSFSLILNVTKYTFDKTSFGYYTQKLDENYIIQIKPSFDHNGSSAVQPQWFDRHSTIMVRPGFDHNCSSSFDHNGSSGVVQIWRLWNNKISRFIHRDAG